MPNIYLPEKDVTALTTFLLGSVETNLPQTMRYNPGGGAKRNCPAARSKVAWRSTRNA
jgi:hypothetical protein